MGGNINIQDCYAAAAMGVPVQPGLAMPVYPRFSGGPSHDEYKGPKHKQSHQTSLLQRCLLFGGILTMVAVLLAPGNKGRAVSSDVINKSWWKPNTWQSRVALWNPARTRMNLSQSPSRWNRFKYWVDGLNRRGPVPGTGNYTP